MYSGGGSCGSWQGGRARHLAVAADHAWLVEAYLRLSEWTGTLRRGGAGTRGGAPAARSLLGRRVGPLLHHRQRRRDARGPSQGVLRRGRSATNSIASRRYCAPTPWRTTRGSTRPWTARSPWPRHSWSGTVALADLVAALAMWNRRHEIVVTGDRRTCWPRSAAIGCRRRSWPGPARRRPLFEGRPSDPGLAYVCQARACRMPAADVETLAGQLEALVA